MTLAEIAAALRLDERTVRRDEATALAKLRELFADHSLDEIAIALRIFFSSEESTFSRVPRRFSIDAVQSEIHAERAAPSPPAPSRSALAARSAAVPRRLPRRFRSLKP